MKLSASDASIMTLAAFQGVSVFTNLMPKREDVRACKPGTNWFEHDMRSAEIMASSIVMGMALLVALLVKSILPVLIGGVTVVGLVLTYEIQLASPPSEG